MSDESTPNTPARDYYSAEEVVDLALECGASATIVDDGGDVLIELQRGDSSMHLDLGSPSPFYEELLCRSWVFVPSSPHRFCDRWNRFPYFGTYSVVYDANDIPERIEAGFAIRVVKIIEFDRFRHERDIFLDVMIFWYAVELLQEGVVNGDADIARVRDRFMEGGLDTWWFGRE